MNEKITMSALRQIVQDINSNFGIHNDEDLMIDGYMSSHLQQFAQAVSEMIFSEGLVNLDYYDIMTVLSVDGCPFFGIGEATGENTFVAATKKRHKQSVNRHFPSVSAKHHH